MDNCNGMCLTGGDVGVPFEGIAYPHPDCPEHGDGTPPAEELACGACGKAPSEIPGYVAMLEDGETADEYVRREEGTLDDRSGKFLCDPCYIRAGMPTGGSRHRWTATPANLKALGIA